MNRCTLAGIALLFLLTADLPNASAQPQVPGGNPANRPTFSPYLNLLGGVNGRGPALNYLGLVRPQIQLNQQFGQLQQQLTTQNQTINQAIQQTQDSLLPPTGNVSVFNTTSGYFNRVPGVTYSAGGFGGTTGGFNRPLNAFGSGGGGSFGTPSFSGSSSRGTRR